MKIDFELLRQTFLEEATESLETMESGLVRLGGGDPDPDLIHDIFRAAHSIKGGAGSVGFDVISTFTHGVEKILDEMREGDRAAGEAEIEVLLASVDQLGRMFDDIAGGDDPQLGSAATVQARIESLLSGASSEAGEAVAADSESPGVPSGKWAISFAPHVDLFRSANDPLMILRELHDLGELLASASLDALPDFRDYDPEECHMSWEIELESGVDRGSIEAAFAWVEDSCELTIETTDGEVATAPSKEEQTIDDLEAPTSAGASESRSTGASIRVDTEKIDTLINMVGELVITQSMLGQIGKEFEADRLPALKSGLEDLQRHTRELQESVMRIRMLPIGFAFNRFPRVVHDMSVRLKKRVELKISGERTELDKTVLERISDPLVHLVRNALDHGIEAPDVRRDAGKPEIGTVSLNAFHEGGSIVIEISDDGGGIPAQRLLESAREKGLVAADEELSRERCLNLVFHPGFSLAKVVTDVSGRGVGMDVVKRNVEALGGNISINSKEGVGTTFSIRLPLTLAILDGQTIRVGEQKYIVPMASIIESTQIEKDDLHIVAGRGAVFRLRESYLPIIPLYETFSVRADSTEILNGLIVVVEYAGQRVGLLVDELLGQQQIVIKSLETNYERVPGISGATILGDGNVALIIDVAGVMTLSESQQQSQTPVEEVGETAQ